MISFAQWSIWINLLIFAASGAAVWAAGTRLAGYVDKISDRTGFGKAFMGMLLLGGITSLPEISTVATSGYTGNAALALNNLFGTAGINIVLLAVADAILGRDALTSTIAKPATLFQGTLSIMLIAAAAAIILAGDVAIAWEIGIGSTALLLFGVVAIGLSSRYEQRHVWEAVGDGQDDRAGGGGDQEERQKASLGSLTAKIALTALAILVAGFCLSQSGDAIARQSGLGASLVGLVLVGFATSLPELSSITAALRLKRYEMAMGDIFGTNLFNIGLIFVADVAYRKGPILNEAGDFEAVAALLALILTGIFLLGLLERRDKTILRMGYDSLTTIAVFGGGLLLLYRMAPG
jgi:cation:H+ antiporter